MKYGAVALVVAVVLTSAAWAQEKAKEKPRDGEEKFVTAVLNFETGSKDLAQYGEAIPDLLAVFLTMEPSLQLVERAKIKHILDELHLGASGIVDDASKAKIGNMTGAKFLITGRILVVGRQLFITAKIINTETGKVGAKMAKGPLDGKLEDLAQKLGEDIGAYMNENAKAMQAKPMTEQEVVAVLQKKLEGKALPKFAVIVPEHHVSRPVVDPAVETEFTYLLRSCGATLFNAKSDATSDWARDVLKDAGKEAPKGLDAADVAIVGEAFSENAGTIERLISVKARVEIKAVEVRTGKILAVGRATATAVDLAEAIAAKSALQKAAGEIALKLIPAAVDAWAKNAKPADAPVKTGK